MFHSSPVNILAMGSFVLWGLTLAVVPWGYGFPTEFVPGTTPGLRSKVTGRCRDYVKSHPDLGNKDCEKIWEAFYNALMNKENCNISSDSYTNFINLAHHSVPQDKALFWSKRKACKHRDRIRFEETLMGYILDDMHWCPTKDGKALNYVTCEGCEGVEKNFWRIASTWFAKSATGVVGVLLKGGAYQPGSIFYDNEVPILQSPRVTHMDIWVINNESNEETCDSGTQRDLIDHLNLKGIGSTCYSNKTSPNTECVYFPNAHDCEITCSVSGSLIFSTTL